MFTHFLQTWFLCWSVILNWKHLLNSWYKMIRLSLYCTMHFNLNTLVRLFLDIYLQQSQFYRYVFLVKKKCKQYHQQKKLLDIALTFGVYLVFWNLTDCELITITLWIIITKFIFSIASSLDWIIIIQFNWLKRLQISYQCYDTFCVLLMTHINERRLYRPTPVFSSHNYNHFS